ncbi:hypothetical protein [Sphingobacterium mizutaii]|nr:hypothetical protein [Sphingobacterium mizutaii]
MDGRIGQDYGKEPGLCGWEDWPRSWKRTRIKWMRGLAKIMEKNQN